MTTPKLFKTVTSAEGHALLVQDCNCQPVRLAAVDRGIECIAYISAPEARSWVPERSTSVPFW